MIRAVISCGEEDLLVKLPLSSTAFQLKTRWADKYSVDIQDLLLSVKGHDNLHDDSRINDIVDDPVDILHVRLERAVNVEFSVLDSSAASVRLSFFLSALPAAQLPRIKEHLKIEGSRPVRLSLNGATLNPSVSFAAQQVAEGSRIEVELGLRVHLKSQWTRAESLEPVICFRKDLVRPTLTPSFEGNFQLLHEGKRLDFDDTISGALGIPSTESQIDYTVELRIPRQLFVMDATGVREISVFDGTAVGELGLSRSSSLMCGAEVLSAETKLAGAGITLLQADLNVVLLLSHEEPRKRRRCVVRLPGRATVYDLCAKAMAIEKSRQIGLYFRGRRLDDFFAELRALGIESGSSVSCEKDLPLKIQMRTSCGKDATFCAPEMRSATYSDLMRFHKAQDDREDLSWAFLKGLSFRCNGCRRLISREMDGRQLVPAPCCDVASLDLTAVQHSADKGVQTCEANRQQSVAMDTQLEHMHMKDASSQTQLLTNEASSQSWFQGSDAVSQTQLLTRDASSQFWFQERNQSAPHSPVSIVRFRIIQARGTMTHWNIDCFPGDSLSDLLEKLSKEANVGVENFTLTYLFEGGVVENRRLRYFVLSIERRSNRKGEVGWTEVFGNHESFQDAKLFGPKEVAVTNLHVTELDDVFYSPGSIPIVSINLRSAFFELGGSRTFNLDRKNATALSNPKYVGWIRLIHLVDKEGKIPPKLLLGSETEFVDVNSGEVFRNRQSAVRCSKIPLSNLQDEYYNFLLRHNSKLPKWPIASTLQPWIFIRDGSDFAIECGVIKIKETMSTILSKRWVFPFCFQSDRVPSYSVPHILATQIVQSISS